MWLKRMRQILRRIWTLNGIIVSGREYREASALLDRIQRQHDAATLHVTVNAIDGASVQRFVESPDFRDAFDREMRRNVGGIRGKL